MASANDTATLHLVGQDIVQTFVSVVVETFLFAIYTILFLYASRILWVKKHSRVLVLTFLAVLTMYILALSLWIIDIRNGVTEPRLTLLSDSTDTLSDRYSSALTNVLRLAAVEDILYNYMTIIGDGVIIWRVFAFWSNGREKLILFVPLSFLVGSISTSVMLTYCAARLGADIELGTYRNPAFCRNIQTASYCTTLATTAAATLLISYKTWKYRKTYRELALFGSASPAARTLKLMIVLIETGVLYMLFFLAWMIVSLNPVETVVEAHPASAFAWQVLQFNSSLIVGIYPTMVVIIVHSNHSILRSQSELSSYRAHSRLERRTNNGGGGGTFSGPHSSTAAMTETIRRSHETTEINLYEMTRVTTGGEDDVKVGV